MCGAGFGHQIAGNWERQEHGGTKQNQRPRRADVGFVGQREIDAEAPLGRIPLYVRAGSIIPLGPDVEYTSEKPAGPIELRIYKGADGTFEIRNVPSGDYVIEVWQEKMGTSEQKLTVSPRAEIDASFTFKGE